MTHSEFQSQGDNDLALDLLGIVGVLRRRILFVLLIAFVFVAATASFSLTLTPIFQATSQVLYDPSVRQPFDDANRPSRFGQGSEVIDSQISVIHSDAVLRPVVRSNNLATDPVFNAEAAPGLIGQLRTMISGAKTPDKETLEAQETAALEKTVGCPERQACRPDLRHQRLHQIAQPDPGRRAGQRGCRELSQRPGPADRTCLGGSGLPA